MENGKWGKNRRNKNGENVEKRGKVARFPDRFFLDFSVGFDDLI